MIDTDRTYGLYTADGRRVADYPTEGIELSRPQLDELMTTDVWLDGAGEQVPEPESYRAYLYTRTSIRPDGVTEYQVRQRGNHPAATPGEAVLSRHRSWNGARRAVKAAVAEFRDRNPGGFGYAWVITDQDGRDLA
jgi:hypothetical protein